MIMVPDSVLQSDLLTPSEKLLFPQLVVICGPSGITKVDNPELAECLNISERSCSAFITNLNRAGFITVEVDRKLKKNQRTIQLNELTQDFALSPVLLQKLMLADADSCVKLAQILASALPDAKSCVRLAQILASTIKDKCSDFQIFEDIGAEFCVNSGQNSGFSDNRDNIYNNTLISSITITNNSIAKNLENSDLTAPADRQDFAPTHVPVFITLNGQRITPETLGQLINLRGIEDEAVAPFVNAHTGRSYNDQKELTDLVRKWLRKTKPKSQKKSVDERRADFKSKLNDYHKQNPGKYPFDFYKGFFDYYGTLSDKGTTMRFEKDNYFFSSLSQKLEFSYTKFYLKNQTYATPNNPRSGKPVKQHGFVSAADLGDEDTAYTDDSAADSASSANAYATQHGLKTVFIDLE